MKAECAPRTTRAIAEMVWILVRKDLSQNRRSVGIYACLAAAGAVLVSTPVPLLRSLGLSSMLAVLIGLAIHLPIVTIHEEQLRKTRAFLLCLPLAPRAYVMGKLLANGILFLLVVSLAALALALGPEESRLFSASALAFLALGWLVFFTQTLVVSLLTESMGWTLAVTLGMIFVVGNGAFQILPGTSIGLYFWSAIEGGVGPYLWIMAALLAELLGSVWLAARITRRKASWL